MALGLYSVHRVHGIQDEYMSIKSEYTYLWYFFDGAFNANSGQDVKEIHFAGNTPHELKRANDQLGVFCNGFKEVYRLGQLADAGFTVTLDGVELFAFKMLGRVY
jgi:hypothetical protein